MSTTQYDLVCDRARLMNRPTSIEGLRAAAIELIRSGLKVRDIAQALQLSTEAVERLIAEEQRT